LPDFNTITLLVDCFSKIGRVSKVEHTQSNSIKLAFFYPTLGTFSRKPKMVYRLTGVPKVPVEPLDPRGFSLGREVSG